MFDIKSALLTTGGDEELLRELARLFIEECPRLMENLREAVANRDAEAVERAAHAIKGSVGHFGARDTAAAAFRLEKVGRNGSLDAVEKGLAVLEPRVTSLVNELRTFASDPKK